MPFIGAGIQTVKGIAEKFLNKNKLAELKNIAASDILDLVSPEKRLTANILLVQTEHYRLTLGGAPRDQLSGLEKEIISLMEANIVEKQEELSRKPATQLDIANLLLTIQKITHGAATDLDNIKSVTTEGLNSMLACQKQVTEEASSLRSETDEKLKGYGTQAKELTEDIDNFRRELSTISRKLNIITVLYPAVTLVIIIVYLLWLKP